MFSIYIILDYTICICGINTRFNIYLMPLEVIIALCNCPIRNYVSKIKSIFWIELILQPNYFILKKAYRF